MEMSRYFRQMGCSRPCQIGSLPASKFNFEFLHLFLQLWTLELSPLTAMQVLLNDGSSGSIGIRIEPVKLSFSVSLPSGASLPRFVFAYLILGEKVALVDTGVKGSEKSLFERLRAFGRSPEEISKVILTHAHPDHMGAAAAVCAQVGAPVLAHPAERRWLEDFATQARERPVPGFDSLVGGSVSLSQPLNEGEVISLADGVQGIVLHTPGHSPGSICLHLPGPGILFSGDALPLPGDLPIYDDVLASVRSIKRLLQIPGLEHLLSAWDEPKTGTAESQGAMRASLDYLQTIHNLVRDFHGRSAKPEPMVLCQQVTGRLGLPPLAANPLVARSLVSHLKALDCKDLREAN